MPQYQPPEPKGAQHYFNGAWHKIGSHDQVFIHDGYKWLSSNKNISQYWREVERKKKEDMNPC